LIVAGTAGLLAMAASCHEPPDHEIRISLKKEMTQTGLRCKYIELFADEAVQRDGQSFHFTMDNDCGAAQWVSITYIGKPPLVGCDKNFPLLRWKKFSPGITNAGTCFLPPEEKSHCHRLEISVRQEGETLDAILIPDASAECKRPGGEDHSLDFHDIPP
jgi:hypothetical protein